MFDGVVAAAPAYRVPLAAIDAVGHTQALMSIAPKGEDGLPDLGSALSDDELSSAGGVLDARDAADGVKDGMVQNMSACKFDPAVLACTAGKTSSCLNGEKVDVIKRIFAGTRNSKGEVIYSEWPDDPASHMPAGERGGWARRRRARRTRAT